MDLGRNPFKKPEYEQLRLDINDGTDIYIFRKHRLLFFISGLAVGLTTAGVLSYEKITNQHPGTTAEFVGSLVLGLSAFVAGIGTAQQGTENQGPLLRPTIVESVQQEAVSWDQLQFFYGE